MSILIFAGIVLIVCAMLIYGIDLAPQLSPFAGLLKLLVIVLAVLAILNKAGIV